MADICKIHANTYQKYEYGAINPDINIIHTLYSTYQVDPTYFFDMSTTMFMKDRMSCENLLNTCRMNAAIRLLMHSYIDTSDDEEARQILEAIKKLL